ncbi:MAG: amino acid ABC transporter permease [Eggerthellaceae bacterium]|nr:amino acid ABC transporter permease [Eggerthellaceae bacterium]
MVFILLMGIVFNQHIVSFLNKGRIAKRHAITFLILLLVTMMTFTWQAVPAYAFEVTSITAKPNDAGTNAIMGATTTRITWEARLDEKDSLSSLDLLLPSSISPNAEDIYVVGLDGLQRIDVNEAVDVAEENEYTVAHISFAEPLYAPSLLRVEVHNVKFPREGGSFSIDARLFDAENVSSAMPAPKKIEVQELSRADSLANILSEQGWVQAWNSNKFLHLFFDPTLIVKSFPKVAKGWLVALGLVFAGIPMAVPLGFVLSLMRMSKVRLLRAIASIYVNIVRGTPMFLQIYIAFFGLPLLGLALNNFLLGAIVMALNSAAYLSEIFRAGIQSINAGQFEAARSLGMTSAQTMLNVIVPQAFRNVIPTVTNEFILMYKDTSLLAAVGLSEMVMSAKVITANAGNMTPYIVAACFYLVVTLPMSMFTRYLEERSTEKRVGASKQNEAKKKQEVAQDELHANILAG